MMTKHEKTNGKEGQQKIMAMEGMEELDDMVGDRIKLKKSNKKETQKIAIGCGVGIVVSKKH